MSDYSKLKYETIEDLLYTTKRNENQPYLLCVEAVKRNPDLIEYVNKKEYFCKYALAKDGRLLQFLDIEYQTPENCLIAVKNNGLALQWVHKQTVEICKAASKYIKVELYL